MPADPVAATDRPVLATKSRRFVALARHTGCGVSFGEPTTLEAARRDAADMRRGADVMGYSKRVGVYELTEVERV